jgi:preprotein translocase subunit SecD
MSVTPPKSGPSVAIIVAIASAVLAVLVSGLVVVTFALLPKPSAPQVEADDEEDEKPTTTVIVIDATWGDGSELDDDELELTEAFITGRLDRAGITGSGFSIDDGQIHVTLGEDADEDTLDEAVAILDRELSVEFRPILDAGLCGEGNDYTDYGPDEEVIFCDLERYTAYQLGPSEVTGSTMNGATTSETENGDWRVTILFGPEGAAELAVLTERLFGNEGITDGVGISVGGEVLSSAEVTEVIQDGSVSISGNLDKAKAEAMAGSLRLAARGLTLSVASATLAD